MIDFIQFFFVPFKSKRRRICSHDLDSGQLEVRGKVQELSYDESAPKGTLWSRLFGG